MESIFRIMTILIYYLLMTVAVSADTEAAQEPVCQQIYTSDSTFNVVHTEMGRHAENEGLHRSILTSVKIEAKHSSTDEADSVSTDRTSWQILLKEIIPSGMYIDPEQIGNHKNVEMYFSEFVDIEKPEFKSDPQTVLVYTEARVSIQPSVSSIQPENSGLTLEASIDYPAHLRYHSSVYGKNLTESYADVVFLPPTVFIKNYGSMNLKSGDNSCMMNFPCSASTKVNCTWMKVDITNKELNVLEFRIPVGQLHYALVVTLLTLTVTMGGAGYLSYIIIRDWPSTDDKKQQ